VAAFARKASRGTLCTSAALLVCVQQTARTHARLGAEQLLSHPGWSRERGGFIPVETTLGGLLARSVSDAVHEVPLTIPTKLMDRALLWLHEQQSHNAWQRFVSERRHHASSRPWAKLRSDFVPLEEHYLRRRIRRMLWLHMPKGLNSIEEAEALCRLLCYGRR
jgi:ATP-dependent DNA helicase RecQ